MKPYPNDLRKLIIDALTDGVKVADAAERFNVGPRFVYSLLRRFRDTGSYKAKKNAGGAPRKISPEDERKIRQIIKRKPDSKLREIKEQANLNVSLPTIYRAMKRMGLR